jgi:hypothetical protein
MVEPPETCRLPGIDCRQPAAECPEIAFATGKPFRQNGHCRTRG